MEQTTCWCSQDRTGTVSGSLLSFRPRHVEGALSPSPSQVRVWGRPPGPQGVESGLELCSQIPKLRLVAVPLDGPRAEQLPLHPSHTED